MEQGSSAIKLKKKQQRQRDSSSLRRKVYTTASEFLKIMSNLIHTHTHQPPLIFSVSCLKRAHTHLSYSILHLKNCNVCTSEVETSQVERKQQQKNRHSAFSG